MNQSQHPRIPPGNFNLIEHPFRPTNDYTPIEGLVERVMTLEKQGRLQTALDEIFKALDAHPGHPQALQLAVIIEGISRTEHLQAQEPISQASRSDRSLDPIVAVCSHCRDSQWTPFLYLHAHHFETLTVFNSSGMQCYNCGYVVCRECLQEHHVDMTSPCLNCHEKQLDVVVFPTGRLSQSSPRTAATLAHILLFREGPLPPDKEDIHELLEHISPGAETPGVEISTFPVPVWPTDIASLANTILVDMEGKGELPPGSVSRAISWPFWDDERGVHGYLVKVPQPSSPHVPAQEPTFDKVTTRDVTKAIDVLFNKALLTVPAMTPSTIEAAYEALRQYWASQALYSGKQTQMRELVSHNLGLLARRTDFLYFMIDNGKKDTGEHYVQVYALMGKKIAGAGTAVAIRLWRSQERIFACGHAGFEEPPKAVLAEVPQKVPLELEDLVKEHVVHGQRQLSALPWDLLLRADILTFTTHSIAHLTPLSMQKGTHACQGRRLSDAIVVVSVVPAMMPSHAMTYFPKGYMEALVALMNRYQFDLKGSSPFIHWIYCFDSNGRMIHLSFLSGASGASAMLVAQDLLSGEEKMQMANLGE